jgi:hypothetical protein
VDAFVRPLLLGLVVPAAAFFAAAFALRGREQTGMGTGAALSLLLAVLFLPATAAWTGWPPFPPITTTQQIGYAVLGAAFLGLVVQRFSAKGAWTVRILFLLAVLGWAARPKVGQAWTLVEAAGIVAGWTALLAGVWYAWERRAARTAAVPFYIPVCVAVGGAAPVFFLGGSAVLAQWDASLVALLGAGGVALAFRKGNETVSLAGAAVPAFGLLVVNALWYSELPWASALLLGVAPAAPALLDRALPRELTAWKRTAWGVLAAGACVALAAGICWAVLRPDFSGY